MNRIVFRLSVPLLLISSFLCEAGGPKSKSHDAAIERVVAAGMEATQKMDWKGYAELVHPESLQDFKKMWQPVFRLATKKGLAEQADLLTLFDKGADLKSLVAMKPKDLFISSIKGLTSQFPHVKESLARIDSKMIGTVREGDDLAYVVVRSGIKDTKVAKVEVIALKRSGAEWKLILPEVIQIMAETFQRTLQLGPEKSDSATVPDKADGKR